MSDCPFFLRLNNIPLCVYNGAFQAVLVVKNPPANAGDLRHEFDPWVWRIPRRRKWQPTPVFLPGRSHGQRSLAGYSPQGRKESDMAWRLSTHAKRPKEFKKGWNSLAGHTFPETENSVYYDYCCLQALPSPLLSGANGSLVTVLNRTIRTSCGKAVCTLWRTPSTAGKTLHCFFFFFLRGSLPFSKCDISIFFFLWQKSKDCVIRKMSL